MPPPTRLCGAVVRPVYVYNTELEGHFSQGLVHFFSSQKQSQVVVAKSHRMDHWRRVSRPHALITIGLSAERMAITKTHGGPCSWW